MQVWLNDGKLYLITPKASGSFNSLTLKDAIACISNNRTLRHDPIIQEAALSKVARYQTRRATTNARYPACLEENYHYATAEIPRRLALVLHEEPQLIAPIVTSLCMRNPAFAFAESSFGWEERSGLVTVSVRFTRLLYAQIVTYGHGGENDDGTLPQRLLGAKLEKGCAFLMSGPHMNSVKGLQSEVPDFMKGTAGDGHGEEHLNDLAEKRKSNKRSRMARHAVNAITSITRISSKEPPNDEEIASWPKRNSSDDWMNVELSEVEGLLQGKSGSTQQKMSQSKDEMVKEMMGKLESFMGNEDAGAEGANFES